MNPHQPHPPLDAWTEVLESSIDESRVLAARDLKPGDTVIDLVTRRDPGDDAKPQTWHQPRAVAQEIPEGTQLYVGEDGRVYGAGLEPAPDPVTFAGVPVQIDDTIEPGTVHFRNSEGRTLAQLNLARLVEDEPQAAYAEKIVLRGGAQPFVHPDDAEPGAPERYLPDSHQVAALGLEPDLVEVDEAQPLTGDQEALVEQIFATMTGSLALERAILEITVRIARLEDVADRWGGPEGSRRLAQRAQDKAEGLRAARRIVEDARTVRISHANLGERILEELDDVPIPLVPTDAGDDLDGVVGRLLADPSFLPERRWAQPGDPLADLTWARDAVEAGTVAPDSLTALEEVAVAAAVDVDVATVERLRDAAAVLRTTEDGPEVIRSAIATGLEHAARTLEAGNPVDDLDEVLEIAEALAEAAAQS